MKTKKITLISLVVLLLSIVIAFIGFSSLPHSVTADAKESYIVETFDNVYNVLADGISGREIKEYGGMPYLSGKSSSTGVSLIRKDITPALDLSEVKGDLYFKIGFYVEDAAAIDVSKTKKGQIELSSSGASDINETCWQTNDFTIKTGWNFLSLPFSSCRNEGGPMDFANINHFRFYIFTTSSIEIGFSNAIIEVVEQKEFNSDFVEKDWQIEGATLSNKTLLLTDKEATLTYKNPNLSVDRLYDNFVMLSYESKISDISASLGYSDTNTWINYKLYVDETENHAFINLEDCESVDQNFISSNADTIKIKFKGNEGDTVLLKSIKIISARNFINAKIRELGDFENLTANNYIDYMPKITQIQEIIDDFMVRADKTKKETYQYFDCEMYMYASDLFENYFAFLCFADKVADFERNRAQGFLLETDISTNSLEIDQMVTFSFNVTNLTSEQKKYNYEIKYNAMVLEDFAEVAKGSVIVDANTTEVVVAPFKTLMGGASIITVELKSGETLLESEFERVNILGKGVFLADCHDHSTRSDGNDTLAVNFLNYFSYGASFVITADHNAYIKDTSDVDYALSVMKAAGFDLYAFKGSEVTPTDNGHTLQYGYEGYVPRTTAARDPNENKREIEEILSNGGYAYIAHPLYPGANKYAGITSSSVVDLYTDFTGIEIINQAYFKDPKVYGYNMDGLAWWDKMNIKGNRKYYGIGNSDAHQFAAIWNAYNGFVLDELTWENIDAALANGNFFATTGPQLTYSLGGKEMGQTYIASGKVTVPLKVNAYCGELYLKSSNNFYIDSIDLVGYEISSDVESSYSIRKVINLYADNGEKATSCKVVKDVEIESGWFYRIEVKTNQETQYAISNPVWVSEGGNFTVNDEFDVKAGEAIWLSTTQTEIYDTVYFSMDNEVEGITVKSTGYVSVDEKVYSGNYVIKAVSASGQEKEITLNVDGVTPTKTKSGCGAMLGEGSILAVIILAVGLKLLKKGKKGSYEN